MLQSGEKNHKDKTSNLESKHIKETMMTMDKDDITNHNANFQAFAVNNFSLKTLYHLQDESTAME